MRERCIEENEERKGEEESKAGRGGTRALCRRPSSLGDDDDHLGERKRESRELDVSSSSSGTSRRPRENVSGQLTRGGV